MPTPMTARIEASQVVGGGFFLYTMALTMGTTTTEREQMKADLEACGVWVCVVVGYVGASQCFSNRVSLSQSKAGRQAASQGRHRPSRNHRTNLRVLQPDGLGEVAKGHPDAHFEAPDQDVLRVCVCVWIVRRHTNGDG